MFSEWEEWVPYPPLKTILCLPLLRTWHIRMNSHPCTWENSGKTAPNDIPYCARMCKVRAWIWLGWVTDNKWSRAGMDRKDQVIEKDEEQHFKGCMKKDLLTGQIILEWVMKCWRGAEYMCGGQWVDPPAVNVITVRWLCGWKQVSMTNFPPNGSSVTWALNTYLIMYWLHL